MSFGPHHPTTHPKTRAPVVSQPFSVIDCSPPGLVDEQKPIGPVIQGEDCEEHSLALFNGILYFSHPLPAGRHLAQAIGNAARGIRRGALQDRLRGS